MDDFLIDSRRGQPFSFSFPGEIPKPRWSSATEAGKAARGGLAENFTAHYKFVE